MALEPSKKEIKEQTAKAMMAFKATGGQIQYIPTRKPKDGARTWKKR